MLEITYEPLQSPKRRRPDGAGLNPPPCAHPQFSRPNISCDHCGRWQWLDNCSPEAEQAITLGWSLPCHDRAICPLCLRECDDLATTIQAITDREPEDGICRIYKAIYARYRHLVPANVARQQARWERDGAVSQAVNAGTPYTVIAKALGRHPNTVHYWYRKASRRPYGAQSPIERWWQQDEAEMRDLVAFVTRLPRIRVTAPTTSRIKGATQ